MKYAAILLLALLQSCNLLGLRPACTLEERRARTEAYHRDRYAILKSEGLTLTYEEYRERGRRLRSEYDLLDLELDLMRLYPELTYRR